MLDCRCSLRVQKKSGWLNSVLQPYSLFLFPGKSISSLEAFGDSVGFRFLLGWIPFRHFLGHGLGCPVDGCHHLFQDISFLSLGVYVFSYYCQLSLIVLIQVLEEKVERKTWGGSVTFICSFRDNFLVWLSILVLTSLGAAILRDHTLRTISLGYFNS